MKAIWCGIFILLFLTNCRKFDENENTFETIPVSEESVEKVIFINDTLGFACGGKRYESGFIKKTIDGGLSWESQTIFHPDKKVYEIYFIDELIGFAGSEDNFIYKTTDGGENWSLEWMIPMGYHEVHRPIVRQFTFLDDQLGYFVGGQDYQVGSVYKTTDQGLTWEFDSLIHEIRGISFVNQNKGFISGYGYIASIGSNGLVEEQLDHPDGFFTAIHMFTENHGITIDQNGGIYKTENGGKKWTKILRKNRLFGKRYYFSDMAFNGSNGVITGDDGLILISKDKGDTWTRVKDVPGVKLNRISFQANTAFIGTQEGDVLKIAL